jgi:hypothetical protein
MVQRTDGREGAQDEPDIRPTRFIDLKSNGMIESKQGAVFYSPNPNARFGIESRR